MSLDRSGAQKLVLAVTDANDGTARDNADWAGAAIVTKPGQRSQIRVLPPEKETAPSIAPSRTAGGMINSGLAAQGYTYINIDDAWEAGWHKRANGANDLDAGRDANGEILTGPGQRTTGRRSGRLRKKIEPDSSRPRYLLTEPWVGYRFGAEGSTAGRSPLP